MLLFALRVLLRERKKINGKTGMSMVVLNVQTDRDILCVVRRKRNNRDFLIYLTKCVNASLFLKLKRIALQYN
jgi:hypothetical protein